MPTLRATSLPLARSSTPAMKPQRLPPHHESSGTQEMQLHHDGSRAADLTEITSQEHPPDCVSLHFFVKAAGKHPAHACDCSKHATWEAPVRSPDSRCPGGGNGFPHSGLQQLPAQGLRKNAAKAQGHTGGTTVFHTSWSG